MSSHSIVFLFCDYKSSTKLSHRRSQRLSLLPDLEKNLLSNSLWLLTALCAFHTAELSLNFFPAACWSQPSAPGLVVSPFGSSQCGTVLLSKSAGRESLDKNGLTVLCCILYIHNHIHPLIFATFYWSEGSHSSCSVGRRITQESEQQTHQKWRSRG